MRAVLSAVLVLLLAACSDSGTGPADGLRVRTDAASYGLAGNGPATVHFTVENTGSTPVQIAQCGEGATAELQQRQGTTWVTVASGICPTFAVYTPRVLAPGESAEGQLSIDYSGRFRLRIMVPRGDEEPVDFATSSNFEVQWLED